MTEQDKQDAVHPDAASHGPARKPYVQPRVIDYGSVGALTQSGGITVKDIGSMQRKGP